MVSRSPEKGGLGAGRAHGVCAEQTPRGALSQGRGSGSPWVVLTEQDEIAESSEAPLWNGCFLL